MANVNKLVDKSWFGAFCDDLGNPEKNFNKKFLMDSYIAGFNDKLIAMFEYGNLPETITTKYVELINVNKGYSLWYKHKGKLYCLLGNAYGPYGPNYEYTHAVIVNPYLDLSVSDLVIGKDVAIMYCEPMAKGLADINFKYAKLLAECDLTINRVIINNRIPNMACANDNNTKQSLDVFYNHIEEGDTNVAIMGTPLLDSLKSFNMASNGSMGSAKEMLELRQYLISQWYIEVGINANYNMKRESLNTNEISVTEGSLLLLCDQMLLERQNALEVINKLYGTNITVDFSSTWKNMREQIKLEQKLLQSNIEEQEKETDSEMGVEDDREEDSKGSNE